MKPLPITPEVCAVSANVVWFEKPEKAIADPVRFLTYLMTYGTPKDVAVIRSYLDDSDFHEALAHAPPGIMDERSWAYWNAMAGHYPPPPMPQRFIPE